MHDDLDTLLHDYGPTQIGAVVLLIATAGVAAAVGTVATGTLLVRGVGALLKAAAR